MTQHFLLSRSAKTLSLADVFRMTDAEVERALRLNRWPDNAGSPVCPKCRGVDAYDCRRPKGAPRFRCRACKADFSITSGTLFAHYKAPLRTYLAAIAIFMNEVKGKAALAISRDLRMSYKAAFVLCHKMREAMATEFASRTIGGAGKVAETDGAYFGGYVKPANIRSERKDRRRYTNQSHKRQCVVIVRERQGRSIPAVFRTEHEALGWIRETVAKETLLNADDAPAWNDLHARFEMKRINHEVAYSLDGACTNQAESYFSRLRRAEIGHHHHIAGDHLLRYAQEASWREDNRRVPNGEQTRRVASLALHAGKSVAFTGYWQRHEKKDAA